MAAALLTAACCLATAHADTAQQRVHTLDRLIRQAVHRAEPGRVHVHIGSTQALSAMSPCGQTPRVQLYGRGSNQDARVSCPDQGWQLYIPLSIRKTGRVVVAAHDLMAGKVLTANDLKLVPAPAQDGDSTADTLDAVVGHTLRAPVNSGTPISLSALQNAVRVHAGQSLTVHVQSGPVSIKTSAIALQDGRAGQSILVKNPETGHRYRVTLTAGGAVDDLGG